MGPWGIGPEEKPGSVRAHPQKNPWRLDAAPVAPAWQVFRKQRGVGNCVKYQVTQDPCGSRNARQLECPRDVH